MSRVLVNRKKKLAKSGRNLPVWSHDQAELIQSFPDTQIWNCLAEHDPRFGANNGKDNKIYNVSQTSVARGVLITSAGLVTGLGQNFQVNGLAEAAQYLAVFDQYRIMQIEVWFKPQAVATPVPTGTLYTVVDYDDANNPNSIGENGMNSFQNVTVTNMNEGVYRRFRPHQALLSFQAGVSSGFMNTVSQWNDSAYPTIQHYGFKALASTTSVAVTYDLTIRYWVQFRNPI